MVIVPKSWGREEWIVNDEYCGKFLHVNAGKSSSLHYHKTKKETYCILKGTIHLRLNGTGRLLGEMEIATIEPGQTHQFTGITDAVILEVSTHHDDEDTVRL